MDRQSFVLFESLLQDLSVHLPSDIITSLRNGVKVQRWPDITPTQAAALSLGLSFFKKFEGTKDKDADANALRKFLSINDRVGKWEYTPQFTWEEEAIGCVKKHLYNFYYQNGDPLISDLSHCFSMGRCGPGASLGDRLGSDYSKMYDSPLTTTSMALYRAYTSSFNGDQHSIHAESFRQEEHGLPKLVEGNSLNFVPKQREISRVICTEPVLNMYGQLGVGRLLEGALRQYFGIDIGVQPDYNRDLARRGSLDDTYCTIDLESASDSLSIPMLRMILPSDFMSYLEALRSPICKLPDSRLVPLQMISTMGNGYTFPLQSAVFAAIVSAAYDMHDVKIMRGARNSRKNFGVFGDDIIVLKTVYKTTIRILSLLGFSVNAEKSFFEGPFRESCGGDYFRGHDVRGVFVKTLSTPQARCIVLNRLHDWSAITGVALATVTRYLWTTLPKRFVPPWENHDAGIKVPYSLVENMRRSSSLQAVLYSAYRPRLRTINCEVIDTLTRRGMSYNPSGLLLSFLRGHVRNGRISLRQREVVYVTKTKVAPSWDYPRRLHVTDTCWQRWETAVWLTVS